MYFFMNVIPFSISFIIGIFKFIILSHQFHKYMDITICHRLALGMNSSTFHVWKYITLSMLLFIWGLDYVCNYMSVLCFWCLYRLHCNVCYISPEGDITFELANLYHEYRPMKCSWGLYFHTPTNIEAYTCLWNVNIHSQ